MCAYVAQLLRRLFTFWIARVRSRVRGG